MCLVFLDTIYAAFVTYILYDLSLWSLLPYSIIVPCIQGPPSSLWWREIGSLRVSLFLVNLFHFIFNAL